MRPDLTALPPAGWRPRLWIWRPFGAFGGPISGGVGSRQRAGEICGL